MGPDLFTTDRELEQIGHVFKRDLVDPVRIGSAIWYLRLKATFHLTISMHGRHGMTKIQRNNCHDGRCVLSFKGKTSSVCIFDLTNARTKIAE